MTKEDYKAKVAALKAKKVEKEVEIGRAKETIKAAKIDLKNHKNELKILVGEFKILKSKWKKQEM